LLSYFIACGIPKGGRRQIIENAALAALAAGISLSYSLFANPYLRVVNLLVLMFIMALVFLQGTVGELISWDRPIFIMELIIGYFVRPFVCLPRPWKEMKAHHGLWKEAKKEPLVSRSNIRIGLQIFIAFIVAVPLLLILASLLSASDPVFREMTSGFFKYLEMIKLNVIVGQIIVFLILLPFTASAVWSYRDAYKATHMNDAANPAGTSQQLYFPPAFAITILTLVNSLYVLFAIIQFAYVFGAWNGNLPDGITPATYARNGFFELAFVAGINIVLLLCCIRFTKRGGTAGLAVRVLSMALLALSAVQLASAMSRMYMYVQAYGLSELRYFVSAFMILIAGFFIFLAAREFIGKFPLMRSMIFAGAAALLILNYSVPDARIAEYNISHFESGELQTLDVDYIVDSLSSDAHIVLLQNEDAIVLRDKTMKTKMDDARERIAEKSLGYQTGTEKNWKLINWSQDALAREMS